MVVLAASVFCVSLRRPAQAPASALSLAPFVSVVAALVFILGCASVCSSWRFDPLTMWYLCGCRACRAVVQRKPQRLGHELLLCAAHGSHFLCSACGCCTLFAHRLCCERFAPPVGVVNKALAKVVLAVARVFDLVPRKRCLAAATAPLLVVHAFSWHLGGSVRSFLSCAEAKDFCVLFFFWFHKS